MRKVIDTLIYWILFLFLTATKPTHSAEFEWPQYRGINRDGISRETGLIKAWPAAGPTQLWRVPTGDGYSAISTANGRLYTMFSKGEDEFVVCLDSTSGKELWKFRSDSNFVNDQGNGPRGTPTVHDGMIYTFGAQGMLYALNADNGQKIWEHDLKKEIGAKIPIWGVASSPLIEGDLLILPVGGNDTNAVVAFNKKDGKIVWKSVGDEPGYSSPIAVTIGGVRQVIAFSGTMLISLNPADGKLYWKYPWKTDWFVNAATPIFIPDDKIFISTSYERGGAMLKISSPKNVQEVWLSKGMKNHFNSSIYHNGYLYGFDNAILKSMDASTGETKWQKSGFGKGSLILADGHLIVLSERGQLVLVEAVPDEYREKASAQVLQGKCWTMPTLSNGKLYLRNQKEILCLNLKE
jgi:outer membrane protein assembly factor BamB